MKSKILIIVLVIANIASIVYAFSQKSVADEQRTLAIQAAQEAEMQRQLAMEQQGLAEQAAAQAREQQMIAEEQHQKALEAAEKCK